MKPPPRRGFCFSVPPPIDSYRLCVEPARTRKQKTVPGLLSNEIDPDDRLTFVTDMRPGEARAEADALTGFCAWRTVNRP